jgi:hypothetical protein
MDRTGRRDHLLFRLSLGGVVKSSSGQEEPRPLGRSGWSGHFGVSNHGFPRRLLYYFTSRNWLPSIKKEGITRGEAPISLTESLQYPDLTSNPDLTVQLRLFCTLS